MFDKICYTTAGTILRIPHLERMNGIMAKVNHEPIVLDVNHMMSDVVGFQYGIDADHVDGMAQAAAAAQHNVALNRGTGWLGWTELPYNQKEIVEKIETVAARVRNEFDAFVVLGIGGSALGPIAIQQALNHLHYNELPAEKRGGRYSRPTRQKYAGIQRSLREDRHREFPVCPTGLQRHDSPKFHSVIVARAWLLLSLHYRKLFV